MSIIIIDKVTMIMLISQNVLTHLDLCNISIRL